MSLWLPETLLSNMSETVEDVERSRENYGLIWMGKPRSCPFFSSCFGGKNSEGQRDNANVLTDITSDDVGKKNSFDSDDPKETSPLTTTTDGPMQTAS